MTDIKKSFEADLFRLSKEIDSSVDLISIKSLFENTNVRMIQLERRIKCDRRLFKRALTSHISGLGLYIQQIELLNYIRILRVLIKNSTDQLTTFAEKTSGNFVNYLTVSHRSVVSSIKSLIDYLLFNLGEWLRGITDRFEYFSVAGAALANRVVKYTIGDPAATRNFVYGSLVFASAVAGVMVGQNIESHELSGGVINTPNHSYVKNHKKNLTEVSYLGDGSSLAVRLNHRKLESSSANYQRELHSASISLVNSRVADLSTGSRDLETRRVVDDFNRAVSLLQSSSDMDSQSRGLTLLKSSAAAGYPKAQVKLGLIYERGDILKRDLLEAEKLYRLAANSNESRAMHNLAVLLTNKAPKKSPTTEAMQLFKRAASHGQRDSQFNLGLIYYRGIGTPKNTSESYKWFDLAAAHGDEEARKMRDEVGKTLLLEEIDAAHEDARKFNIIPEGTWKKNTQVSSLN